MAMLNRYLDGLMKNHRVLQMETVAGPLAGIAKGASSPSARSLPGAVDLAGFRQGNAVVKTVVLEGGIVPGGTEIILGSGAVETGGPGLPVNNDLVVPFSKPGDVRDGIDVVNTEIAADLMAFSLGLQDHIIAGAIQILDP